jgi:hypothetical protein
LICSNYEWFTKAEEEPAWASPAPNFLIRVNLYIYIYFLFRKVNKTLQFMFKQKGVWYGGVQKMWKMAAHQMCKDKTLWLLRYISLQWLPIIEMGSFGFAWLGHKKFYCFSNWYIYGAV